jgi:hypothetical protein
MFENVKGVIDRAKNAINKPIQLKISIRHLFIGLLFMITLTAAGCFESQTSASQEQADSACNMWGCKPAITQFYEYHQLQQIYEARDNPETVLSDYLYSPVTGQLTCFGKSYGYGVPYSTEMSQPQTASGGSVPEPNGLYPSQNTNADWLNRVHDTKKGQSITPDFVEPELIVSPNSYPCTPLQGSSHD